MKLTIKTGFSFLFALSEAIEVTDRQRATWISATTYRMLSPIATILLSAVVTK
jgi:hypothetical protein